VFDKLSFSEVVQLYKRFRAMYSEVKDRLSVDPEADVATGFIVNETRELSLDDLMDHSDTTAKSAGSVLIPYSIILLGK